MANPGHKNNCYMNSALQCLSNIAVFHNYFIKKQRHLRQINTESNEGYKGKLVTAFG